MNLKSEQLKSDLSLVVDYDEKLNRKTMLDILYETLGKENCKEIKVNSKKVLEYTTITGNREVLLFKQISYLGGNGQHPIFKKRIQIPSWFRDIYEHFKDDEKTNVRFIGVYSYAGNVIFAEFIKDTYLTKKLNNSSAHVYINDLYQAMKSGTFNKLDRNGNRIVTVRRISFKSYLDDTLQNNNNVLFDIFKEFNDNYYPVNEWIKSSDAIPEMYNANFNSWKQTEWAGWYLEYKFDKYLKEQNHLHRVEYVGSSNKKVGEFDFDLWFDEDNFFGDLKASDIAKKEAPGNDKTTFIDCINKYDKFWYVIYEHETVKDKDFSYEYEATKFRTHFIREVGEWDSNKPFDELSYGKKMKHSVKFKNMIIIELNRINYHSVLSDFNQGKQPSGDKRNVKVKISKKDIDNFVIFRQDF